MKHLLLATAGLFALAVTPALAAPTGYVGGQYLHYKVDTPFGDDDDNGWGVDGSVAFDAGRSLGVTLNAGYADNGTFDATSGAAHLYLKNPNSLIGGFVGLADANDATVWSVGGEGQYHYANWTLAGALGYAKNDDSDSNLWGGNAAARVFVSDNLRLQGNAGLFRVDPGVGGNDTAWTAGVGGEWQLAAAPVSFFADYAHTAFDDTDVDTDAVRVGARLNFGGGTLKARDRSGADLAGLSSLTNVTGF
ncbi:MAG: hypothetical protein AB7M12_14375 [Hyphomonadaceae bacterium]